MSNDQRPRMTPRDGFVPARLNDVISFYADEERRALRAWSQSIHGQAWAEEWQRRAQ